MDSTQHTIMACVGVVVALMAVMMANALDRIAHALSIIAGMP